jgi:hypothetical protein
MAVVREFPTEVESDLQCHCNGTDIRDWIRWVFRGEGNLTSRRMWALMLHLPDKGAVKTALREGDWDEERYILARIANEMIFSRADFANVHGGKSDPAPLLSPKQAAEDEAEKQAARDVRSLIRAQIHGEFVAPAQPGREFVGEVQHNKAITKNTVGGEV